MKASVTITVLLLVLTLSLSPAAGSDQADVDDIRMTLQAFELPAISFHEESLATVFSYLAEVTEVNIILTEQVLEQDKELTIRLQAGLSAWRLMKVIESLQGDIIYFLEDGIIYVSLRHEDVQAPVVRSYDLSSVVIPVFDFPGPEIMLSESIICCFDEPDSWNSNADEIDLQGLVDLIEEQTGLGSWAKENRFARLRGSTLLVQQTPQVHEEIARLLELLRDSQ